MKRRLALLLCAVFCLFSGCSMEADELLALPQLPAQHVLVQNQINQLLADGVSLSAPLTGTDRSSVQMVDLDQDGTDEAVVFGVSKKNDTTVPLVCIYRYVRGRYELAQRLDGVGDSIDTVLYPRMGPERSRLLAVGWRLGANPVCGLSVYQYDGRSATMLLSSEYTGLCAADFDGDKAEELLVLRYSAKEVGSASLYTLRAGSLESAAAAPLTAGVTKPDSIVFEPVGAGYSGAVADVPLMAPGGEEIAGMVTDVLKPISAAYPPTAPSPTPPATSTATASSRSPASSICPTPPPTAASCVWTGAPSAKTRRWNGSSPPIRRRNAGGISSCPIP